MSSLSDLIRSSFKVGFTGFGGGSALIPVIEREYVQQRKILDDPTFTAHTIVANVTPGALPVKLAALAGSRTSTPVGPFLAALAMGVPGAFLTVFLLALVSLIGAGAVRLVEYAAIGITVFIIVLLIEYIRKVLRSGNTLLGVAIMLVAYIATGFNQSVKAIGALLGKELETSLPQLNAVALIVIAVVVVAAASLIMRHKSRPNTAVPFQSAPVLRAGVVFLVVTALGLGIATVLSGGKFMSLIGFSTVTSFGGGEAYVGVVDGFFLSSGIVEPMHFYGQALPIANALPGSILIKLAAAIGYSFGLEHFGLGYAILFSVLAFLISVCSCCAIVMFVMGVYDKAANSAFVQYLSVVILPVICGLLLSTMASMLNASMEIAQNSHASMPIVGWASILGVVIAWVAHKHIPDLPLLGICAALALVAMLVLA